MGHQAIAQHHHPARRELSCGIARPRRARECEQYNARSRNLLRARTRAKRSNHKRTLHIREGHGQRFNITKYHIQIQKAPHSEVLTLSGKPYTRFTPYRSAWLSKLDDFFLKPYPVERYAAALAPVPAGVDAALPALARARLRQDQPRGAQGPRRQRRGRGAARRLPRPHRRLRDGARVPGGEGPELPRRAPALRHGLDPPRSRRGAGAHRRGRQAARGAETWLSELVWRDFYQQVLHHLPHVVGPSCKPEFDRVRFEHGRHADEAFAAWCEGRTGYPLVDAAMAQINQTGWMHNRLRMVAASFLTQGPRHRLAPRRGATSRCT